MSDEKRSVPTWAKVLAVLIPAVGGAIGSYNAAREEGKKEARASYETLAPAVARLAQAVDDLSKNDQRMWDLYVRTLPVAPSTSPMLTPPSVLFPSSSPSPTPSTRLHRGALFDSFDRGFGAGVGSGHGVRRPASSPIITLAPTSLKPIPMEDAPKNINKVALPPPTFGEAVKIWEQKTK